LVKLNYTTILKTNKYITISLIISILSLAGIPPFAGFFAKLPVFYLLIKTINPLIGLIIIFSSVLSVVYYIRIIRML